MKDDFKMTLAGNLRIGTDASANFQVPFKIRFDKNIAGYWLSVYNEHKDLAIEIPLKPLQAKLEQVLFEQEHEEVAH